MKRMFSFFITLLLLISVPLNSIAAIVFYDSNHIGSPVAMWDEKGEKVWEGEYYPFGEEYKITKTPQENKKRFIGKEKDKETGLTYFGARYMDEKTGRFITPDPVRVVNAFSNELNSQMLSEPQRLNRYAYGLNNPYRYIDPDGEFVFALVGFLAADLLGLVGHVVGATLAATMVATYLNEETEVDESTSDESNENSDETGSIYEVPGEYTESGKPYIGRHNKPNPNKTRKSKDGRDRTKAKVVDKYNPANPKVGRKKEQIEMNKRGGPKDLDNKRNEIAPNKQDSETKGHLK